MKIKSIFTVFFLVIFSFLINSCSDDSSPTPDPDPPAITSLSADEFQAGDIATINGTGFLAEKNTGYVSFGSMKPADSDYSLWSDTKIIVKVPANATDGDLTVTNENGTSNKKAYTIIVIEYSPDITSIDPTTAKVGDEIEITGENFGDTRGDSYVQFNSGVKPDQGDYVSWSATKIKVKVPEGASTGTINVFVDGKKGIGASLTVELEVGDAEITGIDPSTVKAGDEITVKGQNFGTRDGEEKYDVMLDDGYGDHIKIDESDLSDWSDTEFKFVVPKEIDNDSVDVYLQKGSFKSNTRDFGFYSKAVIESVEPTKLVPGGKLTIRGKHFLNNPSQAYVVIGDVGVKEIEKWMDTEIILVVPDDIPEQGVIFVSNPWMLKSNEFPYEIAASGDGPKITIINPSNVGVEEPITITGEGFGANQGSSYVTLNGVKVEDSELYTYWSDENISMTIPVGAESGPVKVVVDGQESNGYDITITGKIYAVDMVEIPVGQFTMGDADDDWDAYDHTVKITQAFLMSKTEISQKLWGRVKMGSNPSKNKDENAPVEQMTWFEAVDWCNRLSEYDGLEKCYTITGQVVTCNFEANGYRLPTEAEWEYACRAGSTADVYGVLENIAWYNANSGLVPMACGSKEANAFGLYDMLGNVAEWCWDWYDSEYYNDSPMNDPKGPDATESKVVRGGSIMTTGDEMTAWKRDSYSPEFQQHVVGFRVVRKK